MERDIVLPSADDVVALTCGVAAKYRLALVILEQTAMRINEVISLGRDGIDAAARDSLSTP